MANLYGQNPWILDTVVAAVEQPYKNSNINVDHFEFVGYGADTDTCQIKDGNGNIIWEGNGASDLEEVRSGRVGWVQKGLFLSQRTGTGVVRVFIR